MLADPPFMMEQKCKLMKQTVPDGGCLLVSTYIAQIVLSCVETSFSIINSCRKISSVYTQD